MESGSSYVPGFLGPNLDYLNWDGGEYLYALTLISTVGYGVFVPSTRAGKSFSLVYAFFGFCLLGFTFGKTTALIDSAAKWLIRKILKKRVNQVMCQVVPSSREAGEAKDLPLGLSLDKLTKQEAKDLPLGLSLDKLTKQEAKDLPKDDNGDNNKEEEEEDFELALLVVHTVLTFTWLCIMAHWFQKHERWDSFLDGFYFAFVTSTTIGFGVCVHVMVCVMLCYLLCCAFLPQ